MRGLAAGAGEAAAAHRVIRAVHLRAAVDQEKSLGHSGLVGPLRGMRPGGGRVRIFSISFGECRYSRGRSCSPSLVAAVAASRGMQGRTVRKTGTNDEEDLYLALDGSATLVVNASIPALVALRGLDLDPAANGSSRSRSHPRRLRFARRGGHRGSARRGGAPAGVSSRFV